MGMWKRPSRLFRKRSVADAGTGQRQASKRTPLPPPGSLRDATELNTIMKTSETELRIDLHCHSSASNGATGRPADIARVLKEAGISAFALAEHDCLSSQEAAARGAELAGIEFMTAVEVSTRVGDSSLQDRPYAHVLGYGFRRSPELEAMIARAYDARAEALRSRLERCRAEGLIDFGEEELRKLIEEEWGGDDLWKQPFGCPMPAGLLLQQKGLGRPGESPSATADRVLGQEYPPTDSHLWPDVRETCDTLHNAGGVAILAHPVDIDRKKILRWLGGRVDGVEIYHPKNGPEYRAMLLDVVAEAGCAFTGGSDLHWYGMDDLEDHLSDAPYACIDSLKAALQEMSCKGRTHV